MGDVGRPKGTNGAAVTFFLFAGKGRWLKCMQEHEGA